MGELWNRFEANLKNHMRAEVYRLGYQKSSDIPADMTFRQWCEDLAAKGLKIDGKPFSLDDRPALVPLYDAIPPMPVPDFVLAVMKATQLGLTVWEVLANIYMALKWAPVVIGMFLPDQATAAYKSEHRFMRIIRSSRYLHRQLTHRISEEGKDERIGEGNVLTRVMGESLLLFLWTSGKVSTESRPMDIVTLDEVQEMTLEQIDKVMARTGDSLIRMMLLLSTANMPDLDIDAWYQPGTQEVWHTKCPHCSALSDLSDPIATFPSKSIGYNTGQHQGAPKSEYVWTCPACGGWIQDPQQGSYIPQQPDAMYRSLLLPRTISPRLTPRKMMEMWSRCKTGDQRKSFYNRVLARPYIDADQIPVTLSHCQACVDEGRRAGLVWKQRARDTYMGIDQMGGFHCVIIKERLSDGRQATIHVEAVFANPTPADPDDSPWRRSAELMNQYGVAMCVVEQLPNVDAARSFCNRFPGRAFMATYSDLKDDHMVWGDTINRSDRKTADDDRSRYTVTLNQYKCMQTSLYRIRDRFCLFPDPQALEQDVFDGGVRKRIPVLQDWVFLHFTKTALVVEMEGDGIVSAPQKKKSGGAVAARKTRTKVAKVGIDPHFSYANMLCDVAWARNHGTSSFFIPSVSTEEEQKVKDIEAKMPGLPSHVVGHLTSQPLKGEVCGRCTGFDPDTGRCRERDFSVEPTDAGCFLFVEDEYLEPSD